LPMKHIFHHLLTFSYILLIKIWIYFNLYYKLRIKTFCKALLCLFLLFYWIYFNFCSLHRNGSCISIVSLSITGHAWL
jgi:hypothetical protein